MSEEQPHMGQTEYSQTSRHSIAFASAEGSVDPTARIASGEIREQTIDELELRLVSGEFRAEADPEALACDCIDCRPEVGGEAVNGVKAAAGSFTMTISDALTTNGYRQ